MTPRRLVLACICAAALCACGSGNDTVVDGGADGADGAGDASTTVPCAPEGAARCLGAWTQRCERGYWVNGEDCTEDGKVCDDERGCVMCAPLRTYCEGTLLKQCNEDGTEGVLISDCAALEGATCHYASGSCISLCAEANYSRSNVGCVYWAVDLDNAENGTDRAAAAQFAVVAANVHRTYQATVTVTMDEADWAGPSAPVAVETALIGPGGLHVFNLPRRDVDSPDPSEHDDTGPQTGLSRRAFRIESTIPIVAYQFNPIDQAFSNAASLLIPESGIDTLYYVVTYPPANPMVIPGLLEHPNRTYVTVVGTQEGTTVRVTPTYDIEATIMPLPYGYDGVPAIRAGNFYEITLGPYQVLNLETRAMAGVRDTLPDLTGTVVDADKPVVVFTGVDLAVVGDETPPGCEKPSDCVCCAEHMEQQVIPKTSMGRTFVVTRSPLRSRGGGWIEPDYYRVLAAKPDTVVTTSLPDVPSFTLGALEYREFKARTGFVLEASKPVHVVQILASQQQCTTYIGDPELIPIPAVEERRATYIFTTGKNFSEHYAVVSMPTGYDATIDGYDVAAACGPAVTTGTLEGLSYLQYTCDIAEGAHIVDAGTQPVGVIVYGYYSAGSYGYPGGSDMRKIFLE